MLIRVVVKDASRKIDMIKLVRDMTSLGLKEAKDFVEQHMATTGDTFLVNVENPTTAFTTLTGFTLWGTTTQPWADLIAIYPAEAPSIKLNIY